MKRTWNRAVAALRSAGWFKVTVLASLCFSAHAASSVKLAWDPSPDSTVTGYSLYYGTKPGSYVSKVDAGLTTSVSISGLKAGVTYYFAAKAYSKSRLEGGASNEVSYTVPGVGPRDVGMPVPSETTIPDFVITPHGLVNGAFAISFPTTEGKTFSVEYNDNLGSSEWQALTAVAGDGTEKNVTDPANNRLRFYRLRVE